MPAAELQTERPDITVILPITGMSCAACSSFLERTLTELPGVSAASVSLLANQATVTGTVPPEDLIAAVQGAGYDASLPASETTEPVYTMEPARHLPLRAGLALAAAAVSMILPMLTGPAHVQVIHWLLLVLALLTMAALSPETYSRALAAARHRTTNMSTLVAIGTLAAFTWSAAATVAPTLFLRHGIQPTVYFEAVDFILAFLLLGAALDGRAKQETQSALRAFAALAPASARVLRDGPSGVQEYELPVAEVLAGDHVLLRPGERIPVDGSVLTGASTVDESLLTGEPMPVLKTAGSNVLAGTINLDGPLTVEATTVGARSTLAQLRRLLAEAQSSRAPTQQLADRASAVFVPAVLAGAALTFVAWALLAHSPPQALSAAVAVLVIACPCAMGLAVPAALTVGIGRAAALGVLIRTGEALERLAEVRILALDKTGTLTEGHPRILSSHFADDVASAEHRSLLELAAALERGSEHPLARAVLDFVKPVQTPDMTGIRVTPGQGVSGVHAGQPVRLGTAAFAGLPAQAASPTTTELHLSVSGRHVLTFLAADMVRLSAAPALHELRTLGIESHILTGDNLAAAEAIAHQLGLPHENIHASLQPADKLALIRALAALHPTAMAGDGLNDAAALAAASVGIAVSGAGIGTDLARESAGVVLLHPDLTRIPLAIRLARRTARTMRQNLGWAVAYNALGLPVAAGVLYPHFHVLLSPVLASAAMALSSVSVLGNSLRLRRFR